jgi:hypothetical protein
MLITSLDAAQKKLHARMEPVLSSNQECPQQTFCFVQLLSVGPLPQDFYNLNFITSR